MWEHMVHGFLKTVLSGSDCCNTTIASHIVFGIIFCAYSGSGKRTVEILPQYFMFRVKSWHRENRECNCDRAKRKDENRRYIDLKI